ncbi:MAG: Holliday junction resolvase RuvX [Bacteroidia bacterium]|nr:Holliday junction resolvase RuvX [Bacteroidia bacterium]
MPRVLAIDYGIKRCGIAISDPLKIIANAFTVIQSDTIIVELKKIVIEKDIDTIVVGYPVNMKSEITNTTKLVQTFIDQLIKEFPNLLIETFDERLTSKMAQQTLILTNTKKTERQNKSNTDLISATILLQNYLDYSQNKNKKQ